MSDRSCSHPANAQLPWFLNGSLEGDEADSIRAHIASCAVCARELGVLSELSEGLARHGLPEQEARPFRRAMSDGRVRLAYGLAAGLALPAALGIFWAVSGFPRGERVAARDTSATDAPAGTTERVGPMRMLRPGATLDLGGGTGRAASGPRRLRLDPDIEEVALTLAPPIDPDARYALELRDPGGAVLGREEPLRGLDAMGRCTFVVPAGLLRVPGDYALVVLERTADGDTRAYRYPFRIDGDPGAAEP